MNLEVLRKIERGEIRPDLKFWENLLIEAKTPEDLARIKIPQRELEKVYKEVVKRDKYFNQDTKEKN